MVLPSTLFGRCWKEHARFWLHRGSRADGGTMLPDVGASCTTSLPSGGRPSPHKLCIGEHFKEKLSPFGSKVCYKLMLGDASVGGHNFEPKGVDGVIVGYVSNSSGRWSRDYAVLDLGVVSQLFEGIRAPGSSACPGSRAIASTS